MNYSQKDKQLCPDPAYALLGEQEVCHADVIKVIERHLVLYLHTILSYLYFTWVFRFSADLWRQYFHSTTCDEFIFWFCLRLQAASEPK